MYSGLGRPVGGATPALSIITEATPGLSNGPGYSGTVQWTSLSFGSQLELPSFGGGNLAEAARLPGTERSGLQGRKPGKLSKIK